METMYKFFVSLALCFGLAVPTSQPVSQNQVIACASGLFAAHTLYEINAAYKRACKDRAENIILSQQMSRQKKAAQVQDELPTPRIQILKPMTWKEFCLAPKYLKKHLNIKRLLASGFLLVTGSFVLLNNNTNQRRPGKYHNAFSETERTYYESYFTQQNLAVPDYNSLDPHQLREVDDFIDQRKNLRRADLWTQALDNWDDRETRRLLEEDLFADLRRQMRGMLTDAEIQRCVQRTIQETKTKRDAAHRKLSEINDDVTRLFSTIGQQRASEVPTPPPVVRPTAPPARVIVPAVPPVIPPAVVQGNQEEVPQLPRVISDQDRLAYVKGIFADITDEQAHTKLQDEHFKETIDNAIRSTRAHTEQIDDLINKGIQDINAANKGLRKAGEELAANQAALNHQIQRLHFR